ncbi:3-methyladenine DNA glycosylase [Cumulibacter soli]|uniref:3-methyladenine DNA glycosylase n=1 Tax=Cumulibacter soli TaxID=2546344 RepID=UPI001067C6B6|nr:3-methyladenine DNA glycosylase [Cumulibacter soli]
MTVTHDWRECEREHLVRVEPLLAGHEQRRSDGAAHPVEDFLFTYYTYRPNQLRRWHPGLGHTIADPDAPHGASPYYQALSDGSLTVDTSAMAQRRGTLIDAVTRILRATLERPPMLGCFGMHEWAMVYRIGADDVRHNSWPLRLHPTDIANVVEERGLRCTHFDAFRFFTEPAAPRNEHALSRTTQAEFEQPGCLHAGMDLYKWAYKLSPAVSSDLVLDAFELARDIRYVDMQASPYDLADLGVPPIAVDTAAGRAQYVWMQREFANRAQPIRRRLLEVCQQLAA